MDEASVDHPLDDPAQTQRTQARSPEAQSNARASLFVSEEALTMLAPSLQPLQLDAAARPGGV